MLVSCASQATYATRTSSAPKWFVSPPANTATTLYGSGHGATVDDAAREALNQIASRLSVTVGSTFEKSEKVLSQSGLTSHSKEVSNNITSKVAQMKFNNYEITQNDVSGSDVFVLVSVDKRKLLTEKISDLKNADYAIDNTFKLAGQKNVVEKFGFFKEVTSKVNEVQPLLGIIYTLDTSFDVGSYFNKYNGYLAEIKAVSSKVHVYIEAGSESAEIVPVVTKHLNDALITIVPQFEPKDEFLVTLAVKTDCKKVEIYGTKVVKFNTDFEVKSLSNQIVRSSRIEAKGSSSIDFKEAGKAAAVDLDKKIKQKGIWNVLGIEKEEAASL